jgi:serine/threonine protein kinase
MEPLNAEWSDPVLINSGANGRIYEVKNEEGRGFILKKMIPNPGGSSFKEEVCNQNYASRFGLSPRVFDFWSCSNCEARMMVMEKAGVMDLDQYFNLLLKDANKEKVCNFVYLVATFYFMIRALNFLGIIHLDTHFKNVMIQYKNGEGDNPLIIDFGMSTFYKDYIRELKDKICSIENSMTVLPELIPIAIDMMKNNVTGTINLTNPGVVSHNEILEMYKEIVDPNFIWENFTIEEQNQILDSKRSNNCLDTTKLIQDNGDIKHIKQAIKECLEKMANCKSVVNN